ncbi:MAG: patatin-like phospholipase family protein [Planctomycetota bacterium]
MSKTDDSKRYRIISLDGGGIRGILTAVWLDCLEQKLGGPLREHCDLIAGTSTGSILACAVAQGLPAKSIITMYEERGRNVFPAPASRRWSRLVRTFSEGPSAPKYDDHGLRETLQNQFGHALFNEEFLKPTVLVTSYDTVSREAVVFKNHHSDYKQIPVWQIVKASCSAPTYFPAHVMTIRGRGNREAALVDGGVVANNPTACAIAEGIRINAANKTGLLQDQFIVGSFGTGHTIRPISTREAREWGAIEWAIPVIDVLMDGASDATDYIAKLLIEEARYFRFQTLLDKAYDDMDNADPPNLFALQALAREYLSNADDKGETGEQKITRLATMLK